jgi:hypothetical protein
MKCDDARKGLLTPTPEFEEAVERHISGCESCRLWLEREIALPPAGLTPPKWEEAPRGLFDRVLPPATQPNPLAWLDPWKWLAAALVPAGVAAVFYLFFLRGPLFIPSLPDVSPGSLASPVSPIRDFSFLPDETPLHSLQFLEPLPAWSCLNDTEGVDRSTESWSFLEPRTPFSFLDNEEKEESS